MSLLKFYLLMLIELVKLKKMLIMLGMVIVRVKIISVGSRNR